MTPGLRLHLHKYLRAEIQARRPRAQSGIIDQVLDFDCASQRQSTDAGWLSSHGGYASPSQTTKFFGLNLGFGRDLVGLRWAQIHP